MDYRLESGLLQSSDFSHPAKYPTPRRLDDFHKKQLSGNYAREYDDVIKIVTMREIRAQRRMGVD